MSAEFTTKVELDQLENRVIARFNALDARLNQLEATMDKLEAKIAKVQRSIWLPIAASIAQLLFLIFHKQFGL